MRTARAKGLGEPPIVGRHVLDERTAADRHPVRPDLGRPPRRVGRRRARVRGAGAGHALVQALTERDWMMIQNLVLLYGVIFVLINLVVDLSYGRFDPRIRYR